MVNINIALVCLCIIILAFIFLNSYLYLQSIIICGAILFLCIDTFILYKSRKFLEKEKLKKIQEHKIQLHSAIEFANINFDYRNPCNIQLLCNKENVLLDLEIDKINWTKKEKRYIMKLKNNFYNEFEIDYNKLCTTIKEYCDYMTSIKQYPDTHRLQYEQAKMVYAWRRKYTILLKNILDLRVGN